MEGVGLLAVFVGLLAVLGVMTRGMRSAQHPGGARSWGQLREYSTAEDATDWAAPLLGLLAISALVDLHGEPSGAGTIGATLGLVGALTPRALRSVRDLVLSVIGFIAALYVGAEYLAGTACSPDNPVWRVGFFALIAVILMIALLAGVLAHGLDPRLGLGVFGLVELAVFLSSPFGVELSGLSAGTTLGVALVAAALVGLAPTMVISLLALGIGLAQLAVIDMVGDACTLPGAGTGFVLLVSYAAVYFVCRIIVQRFR